jgi:hypothetical protein
VVFGFSSTTSSVDFSVFLGFSAFGATSFLGFSTFAGITDFEIF